MSKRINNGRLAAALIVPLFAAMSATPLLANDRIGQKDARANESARTSPQRGKIVSGGVGIGARDALQQRAEDYELKLVFAKTPSGDYLAEVPVTITDRRGNKVIDAVSDGPWMYVDLPNGTYAVQARFDGRTETRQVSVTSGAQRTVYLRFPDGRDGNEAMNVSAAR